MIPPSTPTERRSERSWNDSYLHFQWSFTVHRRKFTCRPICQPAAIGFPSCCFYKFLFISPNQNYDTRQSKYRFNWYWHHRLFMKYKTWKIIEYLIADTSAKDSSCFVVVVVVLFSRGNETRLASLKRPLASMGFAPLCKLWEHRFSVPDLVSSPPPVPSFLDLLSHLHGNKTIVLFFFIFIPKWQTSLANVRANLKKLIKLPKTLGLSLKLKNRWLKIQWLYFSSKREPSVQKTLEKFL